jgi:hypothetical protein
MHNGTYAKAVAAATALAEEQYKRTRGLDSIPADDETAKAVIQRQVTLQIGEIPQTTQSIMDVWQKLRDKAGYDVVKMREDMEDGQIDDENLRELWNEVATDDVKVDSTGKIGAWQAEQPHIQAAKDKVAAAVAAAKENTKASIAEAAKYQDNDEVSSALDELNEKLEELAEIEEEANEAQWKADAEAAQTSAETAKAEIEALKKKLDEKIAAAKPPATETETPATNT